MVVDAVAGRARGVGRVGLTDQASMVRQKTSRKMATTMPMIPRRMEKKLATPPRTFGVSESRTPMTPKMIATIANSRAHPAERKKLAMALTMATIEGMLNAEALER